MWKPKASVAPAFSELLTQMWSRSNRGAVNPTNFLNKVARYDSRWGEGRQHDSQEFLHSLLAALQVRAGAFMLAWWCAGHVVVLL
jgi:ubiquitin C-terminal hydrolase